MKKSVFRGILLFGAVLLLWLEPALKSQARDKEAGTTIKAGIYAGDISLEGMTAQEAKEAVESYIASLSSVEITLLASEYFAVTIPMTSPREL